MRRRPRRNPARRRRTPRPRARPHIRAQPPHGRRPSACPCLCTPRPPGRLRCTGRPAAMRRPQMRLRRASMTAPRHQRIRVSVCGPACVDDVECVLQRRRGRSRSTRAAATRRRWCRPLQDLAQRLRQAGARHPGPLRRGRRRCRAVRGRRPTAPHRDRLRTALLRGRLPTGLGRGLRRFRPRGRRRPSLGLDLCTPKPNPNPNPAAAPSNRLVWSRGRPLRRRGLAAIRTRRRSLLEGGRDESLTSSCAVLYDNA
ncbi:hypothetical protein B0H14DRAFT_651148 [Mycena olivaceomarginata]|nr:hypothetical protein B0H14DRAFT_651148 [Mycena olivaceomarginata]